MYRFAMLLLMVAQLAACTVSHDDPFIEPSKGGDKVEPLELKPQTRPADVPETASDSTYYGVHKLTDGEPLEFMLRPGNPTKYVDFEYVAAKTSTMRFHDYDVSYTGSCGSGLSSKTWMNVSVDGYVYSSLPVILFSSWTAYKGERYLLRFRFPDSGDCTSIYLKIGIKSQD